MHMMITLLKHSKADFASAHCVQTCICTAFDPSLEIQAFCPSANSKAVVCEVIELQDAGGQSTQQLAGLYELIQLHELIE